MSDVFFSPFFRFTRRNSERKHAQNGKFACIILILTILLNLFALFSRQLLSWVKISLIRRGVRSLQIKFSRYSVLLAAVVFVA